jgi:hypothetical protein
MPVDTSDFTINEVALERMQRKSHINKDPVELLEKRAQYTVDATQFKLKVENQRKYALNSSTSIPGLIKKAIEEAIKEEKAEAKILLFNYARVHNETFYCSLLIIKALEYCAENNLVGKIEEVENDEVFNHIYLHIHWL